MVRSLSCRARVCASACLGAGEGRTSVWHFLGALWLFPFHLPGVWLGRPPREFLTVR